MRFGNIFIFSNSFANLRGDAVREYVVSDPGISQFFSQDIVDEAALFRRDGVAFAKVVLWVFFLLCCEVVCKNIIGQFSETILIVGVLCSSAVCSKTIKTMPSNPYAPFDKAELSTASFFIDVQSIPDFLVRQ